jgi:hypothetical protein
MNPSLKAIKGMDVLSFSISCFGLDLLLCKGFDLSRSTWSGSVLANCTIPLLHCRHGYFQPLGSVIKEFNVMFLFPCSPWCCLE